MLSSMRLRSEVKPGVASRHHLAESVDRKPVDGTKNRVREALGGLLFERQIVARTQAGIDGKRDRERQRGFLVEDRNLLLAVVFLKNEIVFREAAHGRSLPVRDGHEDVDQVDVNFQGSFGFVGMLRLA